MYLFVYSFEPLPESQCHKSSTHIHLISLCRDGEIFIETCSDDLRERETTSDDLLSVLEAAAPSPLPLSNFYQEFIAVDSMPLPSSYIEFSSHSHSTPSKMGGVDERQQHRSPAPGSNSKSPCLPKPPRVPSASRGNPTRDCGEGSGQGEVTDGSAGSVEVESCSSCFDKFLSAGYGELSECDLEPQQQMQVHVQQLQVKKEQQEENGTEIALSGTVHAKAQGSDVIVASDSELGNDIRIQVAAEHGDNSELLSLLRGLLNKKNTEIQTLTAALHKTQALSDSLRQDLSLSKTDLSHLSAALINKEGEVAKHRHSLQVRDNTLQRQLRDSSSRCAHLSERVTSLEAQNESLRQLQQDQALRNQVEQHLLNERMEDSLRLVAALEGKSTAAEREKELLLMHATHRLQAQELCVREYRQQLEQALSDKIRIERGIAQGGVCSNGSNSLDVCISSVSSNRTTQVLDTQKPLPCNFTHYLPSCMDVLQSPVAHRDNAKSGAACVGRAQQAQHGWAQDVIEVTDGVMGRSVTENCRDAHTKTSEILFVHNQILCNEVIRLRQALASDERDSSSLFPPLHSSSRAPPPTSGRGDSGEKTSDKTAQDKMSRPSGLMRCEIETHAPSYFSPSSPAASFFKDTDVAGVSPGVSGGGGGGERGFGLQQTTSAAITKDLKAEADMVSWQWMAAMDGAGVQRAAQATVLFASPPPQLSRDYEPLSDWV